MGKYTLRVEGHPIVDARELLTAAEGIHVSTGSGLIVTVDAPTIERAKQLVHDALPSHGSYTVGRPDPLEDDER